MVVVAAVNQTDQAPAVIEEGHALADAFGDELHVVHVFSQSKFAELEQKEVQRTGQPAGKASVEEMAAETAAELAELVTEEFTPVGLIGEAHKQLTRYAREQDARYLVVGGRKRSPVGKAVFGSTTHSVLMNAETPVVTVINTSEDKYN